MNSELTDFDMFLIKKFRMNSAQVEVADIDFDVSEMEDAWWAGYEKALEHERQT